MPNIATSIISALPALTAAAGGLIGAIRGTPVFTPPINPRGGFPSTLPGGARPAGFELPFVDIVPEAQGRVGASLSSPFAMAAPGLRAQTFVLPNPTTGRPTWFRPAGRPILWSSDLSACGRVNRIAARARRARGRRRGGR